MAFFSLRNWLTRDRQASSRHVHDVSCRRFRPVLETLEGRVLPSTVTWTNAAGGDWDTPSNWSSGSIPTAADDVQILTAGITVTHSASRNDFVHSLNSKAAVTLSSGQLYLATPSTVVALTMSGSGGTIDGPGNLTITGMLTWTAGTMAGNGTTNANGGITLNGNGQSASETLSSRRLSNAGNAVWTGSNSLVLSNGAIFNNLLNATFTVQNDQTISGSGVFNNFGTFMKATGGGTTTISAQFNNLGTVKLTSGSLDLKGASTSTGKLTLTAVDALKFEGPTRLSATSSISGAGSVVFNPTIGTSNGPSVANVLGTYNVTGSTTVAGGTVNFAGTLNSVGTQLTISGGTANFLRGFTTSAPKQVTIGSTSSGATASFSAGFSSQTLTLTGPSFQSGTTLTCAGSITVTNALNWGGPSSITGPGSVTVAVGATLTLSGDNTTKTLDGMIFNNAGMANWTGTDDLNFKDGALFNNLTGATFNAENDQQISGDGTGTFNNQGTFSKSFTTNTTTINTAFVNSGSVKVNDGTVVLGGGVRGGGSYSLVAPTSMLNIGPQPNIIGKITGAGSVTFMGNFSFNSPVPFDDVVLPYAITGTTTVNSEANVEFLAGASTGGFTNDGTVTVAAGITLAVGGEYTQTGGTTLLDGGTLQANDVNINGGNLSGVGTISANVNVSSSGILNVGDMQTNENVESVGLLTIKGNYTQNSGGTLDIEIGGNIAGTLYDQLVVTGTATLGGNLDVSFINSFSPASGTWAVLKCASLSGMFASASVPFSFGVHYSGTSVTVS
jgi:hypothetical protein